MFRKLCFQRAKNRTAVAVCPGEGLCFVLLLSISWHLIFLNFQKSSAVFCCCWYRQFGETLTSLSAFDIINANFPLPYIPQPSQLKNPLTVRYDNAGVVTVIYCLIWINERRKIQVWYVLPTYEMKQIWNESLISSRIDLSVSSLSKFGAGIMILVLVLYK